MDLSVSIGSYRLVNPLIAASGCFGYGVEYGEVVLRLGELVHRHREQVIRDLAR